MFFSAQFDQTELGRRSYCATKRTAHSMVRTSSKGTQTKGTDMTGNTTARTQAIELGEHLREVAAWNVRLHLAKEGLEQQTLCEAAGVTKATISARMNLDAAWDLNAIAAAAVTLGMPPAELLDDTLYDIVNNDDTNTGADKGASLVAALTSTLLARHIAGRCNPLKTKGSCRITMMATGAEAYPQRGCIRFILHIRTCNFFLQLRDRCQRGSKGESSFRYPVRFTGNTKPSRNYIEHCAAEKPRQYPAIPEDNVLSSPAHCCSCGRGGGT